MDEINSKTVNVNNRKIATENYVNEKDLHGRKKKSSILWNLLAS